MPDQNIKAPLLSVVTPCYNEEAVIHEFYSRLSKALSTLPDVTLEMLFVDDGSGDRTREVLLGIQKGDPRVGVIQLSRNFGHQIAVTAGIDQARGDAVVVIDADLQDPPEVIPGMIAKWREGYRVVYGVREKRKGEGAFKLLTASVFYRMLNRLSDTPLPLDTGDFRLMDRAVVDALKTMREESRYLRGMVSWLGFRQCGLPYARDARCAGSTKYTLRKMLRFAFNGITSFSEKPLIISAWMGLFVTAAGFTIMLYILISKFLNPSSVVSGWASLMGTVVFFGGIQLLSLGILGQYIGRIYREVKHRPLYVVERSWSPGSSQPSRS